MDAKFVLENQWPYLMSFLPPNLDLERSVRDSGALIRRRSVGSAEDLLRLALVYGFCGLSLRQTAAWAAVSGVASLSDVAVLKRLRAAAPWLGQILGAKLAQRAKACLPSQLGLRLRLVDATVVSKPGSRGTDWRVHLGFDLSKLAIDHLELTDHRGGESLRRFPLKAQELLVGDRGYAHRSGMIAVREAGSHFLIRLNWNNVPLEDRHGEPFEIVRRLRQIPEATVLDLPVKTVADPRKSLRSLKARLVAVRKSEAAATESRRKIRLSRSKKQKTTDPRTLEAANYVFVLTSVPEELLSGEQILEIYRFRWQIELAFKRLKSVLYLDQLPAKDEALSRSFFYAKLLAALLLEDFTERFLAFSPWGFPLRTENPQPLENP